MMRPGSAVDVALMLGDGGQATADLAVLRDQAELFGVSRWTRRIPGQVDR